MRRWKPRFAASTHEAAVYAASCPRLAAIGDYIRSKNPAAAVRVRAAILETLQMLLLFPHAGRKQTVEGVRRIVTRRYAYIVYYSVDLALQEVVIDSIQHPAREREYSDV